MLTLIGFCFYCITTAFGTSDKALVFSGGTVDLPFANSDIGFTGFLIIGPILMVFVFQYLHIFDQRRLRREYEFELAKPDTIFTLDKPMPKLMYRVIFFWMVPVTLLAMYLKASARLSWSIPIGIIVVTVLVTLVVQKVWQSRNSSGRKVRWWLSVVALAVLTPASFYGVTQFERPIYIYRADLSNEIFRFDELRNAALQHSNMKGIDLFNSDLTGTQLYGSDLTGAIAEHAKLDCTDLRFTKLKDVNFRYASLKHVSFPKTDLTGVDFENADLRHAIFADVDLRNVNFTNANLRGTHFIRTKLNCENFQQAEIGNLLRVRSLTEIPVFAELTE